MTILEKIQMDWDLFIRIVGNYNILGKIFMVPLLFFIAFLLCVIDIIFMKRENW